MSYREQKRRQDGNVSSSNSLSSPFSSLRTVATAVQFVGGALLLLAVVMALMGLTDYNKPSYEQEGPLGYFIWAGGSVVAGFLIVAASEVIKCFLAIERNTRRAFSAVEDLTEQMRERSA